MTETTSRSRGARRALDRELAKHLAPGRPRTPAGQALVAGAPSDWAALSAAELDEIDRVCAALLAATRRVLWARAGWQESSRWDRHGPGVVRGPSNTYDVDGAGWLDHGYRLLHASGRRLYVSEPYDLGPEGLRALGALEDRGWRVGVRGWGTRHFPGHTLAVVLERPGDGRVAAEP